MNGKLYIKKFIRDDGETLSFDAEEIYLSENNTLLVRSDPATTAVEFTEEDGGEMIRQRGATYSQPVSGLIVPKSTEYWALCVRLSRFFILNHTYKIVYIKRDGSMFSMNRAWINAGLQIVPVPYENYSTWTIEFKIGDNFWTEYAEDGQGKEIYSNSVELPLLTAGTGGEVWSDVTQQTLSGIGNYFTIDGTSTSASINKLEMRGDANQDGTPTPSSPITIDVVTGEQTVTVTGKNAVNLQGYSSYGVTGSVNDDGSITISGAATSTAGAQVLRSQQTLKAGTYTMTISRPLPFLLNFSIANGVNFRIPAGSTSVTTTLPEDYINQGGLFMAMTAGTTYNETFNLQIVAGSTPDYDFEPYHLQSYTVDLGSIELCKIDDYQDEIFNNDPNEDWYDPDLEDNAWYVHKEIGKLDMSTITGWGKNANGRFYRQSFVGSYGISRSQLYSNIFLYDTTAWVSDGKIGIAANNNFWMTTGDSTLTSASDVPQWLEDRGAVLYGALVQPTNTKITGAALVAQLNALAGAQAYNGKTVYQTDSATMPAILSVELLQSVGGGEVWDNVGAVWEEGVGGVQTINVETTQTTYPVWTVTGPCSNPTLQNDTTDTIASFDGMIASGQTLTVDFADNTAYLDSAPVAKYVSGYVSLAPGENVIGFNSDGGSTQTSTISWDNIIN